MIDVEYCRLLARYNRWMNERMFAALATLPDDERKRDRGAFFGSIHRTLDHILWGDRIWLGRFTGAPHAVACNSGTAALHLACIAAGLGESPVMPLADSIAVMETMDALRAAFASTQGTAAR